MKHTLSFVLSASILMLSCKNLRQEEKHPKKIDIQNVNIDRYPLPYPPELKYDSGLNNIDSLYLQRDSIQSEIIALSSESVAFVLKQEVSMGLKKLFGINSAKISKLQGESLCGVDDSQPIESYDGTLGVSIAFAQKISRTVGQLQWKYSFGDKFKGESDNEGNTQGARWCTGTLIGKNIFITAGHCFDRDAKSGWDFPEKNGEVISADTMASMMKVNFNYQIDKVTNQLRTDSIDFPIDSIREYRNENLDYVIVFLGKSFTGKYPGEIFGFVPLARTKPKVNDVIAVIQQPLGKPKVIEAGKIFSVSSNFINYDDIDTQAGSSGAGVVSANKGEIVGIHVAGGCDKKDDGSNHSTPIFLILQKSKILQKMVR